MEDTELYREQILRHSGPIVTGTFLGYQASYTREVKIGQPLVLAVFVSATLARLLLALIRLSARGAGRKFKDLKKGPEFLVTPLRLEDQLGQRYEVEMHGHLPLSALHRGDLVQVTTAPQADRTLPVRLVRIINLTTLQPLTPRIPTVWSHIGPAIFLQAVLGILLVTAVAAFLLR